LWRSGTQQAGIGDAVYLASRAVTAGSVQSSMHEAFTLVG
jgi:hypothetical protein